MKILNPDLCLRVLMGCLNGLDCTIWVQGRWERSWWKLDYLLHWFKSLSLWDIYSRLLYLLFITSLQCICCTHDLACTPSTPEWSGLFEEYHDIMNTRELWLCSVIRLFLLLWWITFQSLYFNCFGLHFALLKFSLSLWYASITS